MNSSVNLNNYVCICSTYPPTRILVEGVGLNYKLFRVKYLGSDTWVDENDSPVDIYYWRFLPNKAYSL